MVCLSSQILTLCESLFLGLRYSQITVILGIYRITAFDPRGPSTVST